jgi:hypothetical protein
MLAKLHSTCWQVARNNEQRHACCCCCTTTTITKQTNPVLLLSLRYCSTAVPAQTNLGLLLQSLLSE